MEPFSSWILPLLLTAAALWGCRRRVDVYDALVCGGKKGLHVAVSILPALAALLTAVYMLRASGALDGLTHLLAPLLTALGVPPETAPLLVIRPLSGSGALAALDVDERILERLKDVLLEILVHGGVDVGDELVDVGGLQVGLGQDETQGGRRIADGLFHALPILGLGRELVAGDDGPLLHIDVLVGQQDVSGIEAELTEFFVHGVSS